MVMVMVVVRTEQCYPVNAQAMAVGLGHLKCQVVGTQ